MYWRPRQLESLSLALRPTVKSSECDLLVHNVKNLQPDVLCRYVDSDWGTNIAHCRSVTGMAFMLAGSVVAYKMRYQPTVALFLTEAEFVAA